MSTINYIGIAVFFITLIIDLWTDIRLWKQNKAVNHKRGAWLRLIGLVPSCVLMGWPVWLVMLLCVPVVGFVYWNLFDGLYNILRGFKWFYTGSEDPDDAVTDNFLQRLKPWQHILIKAGGIIISILILLNAKTKWQPQKSTGGNGA